MQPTSRLITSLCCCLLLVTGVGSTALAADGDTPDPTADSTESTGIIVDYRGQLQDADGNPISGVFHLAFKLYGDSNAAEASWTTNQYVAIDEGTYKVPLGQRSKLSRSTIEGPVWIGVELVGEGEILRDRFRIQQSQVAARQPAGGGADGELVDTSKTRDMITKARNTDQMAFADVSERSVTADKAEVAEKALKVGSMSAKEIERLSNLAMERLGEHIADPDAHQASGGKIGDERRVMDSVGGPGGRSYERKCPPGYVVTGIRGGAGRVLDSISIICQPLR
jgi:hypothetical protein